MESCESGPFWRVLLGKTSYRMCGAQCKLKMRGPLFKKQEFPNSNKETLDQVEGPSESSQSHTQEAGPAPKLPSVSSQALRKLYVLGRGNKVSKE